MKLITVALLFLLTIPGFGAQKPVTFELIDIPYSYGQASFNGINNAGDISGTIHANGTHGFIRKASGEIITLRFPGAAYSEAYGLDDQGAVAGRFSLEAYDPSVIVIHSFLYKDGQYTPLDYPGATETYATSVNAGRVVGFYNAESPGFIPDFRGFLWSGGQWIPIDYPGVRWTLPFGINAEGKIYGWFDDNGMRGGFVYSNGQYEKISVPAINGLGTSIYGANDRGDMIGVSTNGCNNENFLLTRNGKVDNLDLPGVVIRGINNDGMIVGNLGTRGFIARASSFILRGK